MRRASGWAAGPLAVAVLLGLVACGPAGGLAPAPVPEPSSPSPTTATSPATTSEPATPAPTETPTPTPTQTPTPTPTPQAARTPPTTPPLPVLSPAGTPVPVVGAELAEGERYDYLIPCAPAVPMWFDAGDGRFSHDSTDRMIPCDQGLAAAISVSVGREMSLLTAFEQDIGAPTAFRVVTGAGFDEATAAEVAAQTGAQMVDIELACAGGDGELIEVGDRYAYCTEPWGSAVIPDVAVSDALTQVGVGFGYSRELFFRAS
ncbi:hypothetical protein [Agrococcus jenensis]|uniref:Uncharacterized protein n=1 Tax=Agrococcus jenensis TaxID=46353 RepID=A0A3N2AQP5_9MICO|nr:hypothetical protein [Agrococcus jenensis]ROR65357.1 hypothetical protein EDD26_0723 [Agrococcus jenensis]